MDLAIRKSIRFLSLLAIGLCLLAPPASSLTLTLRSGNAPAGNPDPLIRRLDLATSCGLGYATPFTSAEFNAALAGPQAFVIGNPHPLWMQGLACDPNAGWIGRDNNGDPMSVLYAMEFDVPDTCCYTRATLDFCWGVDDGLGDAVNPAGLYFNEVPIAAVSGGNFATDTSVNGIDVLSLIHCGRNTLHLYDRDLGCAISGVIFSARLTLVECVTPTAPSSWGSVKARYR